MRNEMKSAFGGNKLLTKILLGVFAVFLFAGTSFAATSIRLQQPASPTNKDAFDIVFVALETNNNPVTVQCYKKAPSDGTFVAFGSAINLSAGGDTDACKVNSGVITTDGTYQFKATANGTDSNVVSVDRNGSTKPGTPTNYSKEKPEACTYKISFRSANDSGKTVKVVLYRSTDASFNVDSSHQVSSVDIGSDTQGSMTDNVSSNCDTTYYYAIRAFDVYGNGSDVGGDSNIVTTVTSPASNAANATPGQGAIPVGGAGEGQVLGEETKSAEKGVLGTESAKQSPSVGPEPSVKAGQNPITQSANWVFTHKKISLLAILILGGIGFYLYRRFGKRVE